MTPSLFEWAERARFSDPDTSVEAAEETAKVLTVRRQQFLRGLSLIGMGTANEIARAVTGDKILADSIRKRAHELVRCGRIVKIGKKICEVSGHNAAAYIEVQDGEQATKLHKL